jgi:hypothetical protein
MSERADRYNAEQRERTIYLNSQTCTHWQPLSLGPGLGPGNDRCKADVHYRENFGDAPGIVNRLPCRPTFVEGQQPKMDCPIDGFRPIGEGRATREYDESIALFEESHKRCMKAVAVIDATGNGPRQGRVKCPNCTGMLGYSVASNGHRMAQCTTHDCVSFIE